MRTKFIYSVVFFLIVHIADAQIVGIKGGANFANVNLKTEGTTASPEWLTGFNVGLIVDYKLKNSLHFSPSFLYSVKGFTQQGGGYMQLRYTEIPLDLVYKIPLKEKSSFFIQAGPYIGFGSNVKAKMGSETETGSFSEARLKKTDFGLGLGAGIELDNARIGYSYQIGFADINDEPSLDASMKNKVSQIYLAIFFGGERWD